MAESVRIENVVVTYPHLWEKHAPPGTEVAKYGAEFILDPAKNADSLAKLDAAFKKVATDAGKGALVAMLKNPCQPGDAINALAATKGKNPRPEIAGKRVLRASDSNYQPVVVDQNMRPMGPDQAANVFGGAIVNAFVDLYWSANATNPGVYAGLRGVQLVSNVGVERLGGGALSAEAMFVPVAGAPASADEGWL